MVWQEVYGKGWLGKAVAARVYGERVGCISGGGESKESLKGDGLQMDLAGTNANLFYQD